MNITIVPNDTSNGPGIRVSVFVWGCEHACKNCHNEQLWQFSGGEELTYKKVDEIELLLRKEGVSGLSILGGEPLHPRNREGVVFLITELKTRLPELQIWLWTGFSITAFMFSDDPSVDYIYSEVDCIIDGAYIEEKRVFPTPEDRTTWYRGSSNQGLWTRRIDDNGEEYFIEEEGIMYYWRGRVGEGLPNEPNDGVFW